MTQTTEKHTTFVDLGMDARVPMSVHKLIKKIRRLFPCAVVLIPPETIDRIREAAAKEEMLATEWLGKEIGASLDESERNDPMTPTQILTKPVTEKQQLTWIQISEKTFHTNSFKLPDGDTLYAAVEDDVNNLNGIVCWIWTVHLHGESGHITKAHHGPVRNGITPYNITDSYLKASRAAIRAASDALLEELRRRDPETYPTPA